MESTTGPKTPFLKHLRQILVDGIRRIDSGECDEGSAMAMIGRYNAESKGFVDDKSTVNYDEAMRITGIKSRNTFKALCEVNHINQVKINNMNVGFLRSQIEDLAYRLRENNRKGTK